MTYLYMNKGMKDELVAAGVLNEQGNEGVNPKYQGSNTVEIKSDFFEPKIVSDNLWFPDIAIRQDEFLNELSVEQKFGNAFHLLMSGCDSQEEIDSVLETLILQDEIPAELKAELRAKGLRAFELMKSKGILMDAQTVMNETSIIVARDSIKRPDKLILKSEETILIDFKTGAENPKYLKQINEYASALKEMNLPKIKAYLYYTNTESLQEVMCE